MLGDVYVNELKGALPVNFKYSIDTDSNNRYNVF